MNYKEKDIMHENGKFWVLKNKQGFHVMISGVTHSVSESSYERLDLAVTRCDYLANRVNGKAQLFAPQSDIDVEVRIK